MRTDLRNNIARAQKDLSLEPDFFKPVSLLDWKGIQERIENSFVNRKYGTSYNWYWEDFKRDTYGIAFNYDPYEFIDRLVNVDEPVWFFVNETINGRTKFWFYEGTIQAIQKIIEQVDGIDEYYISSKKYDWLFCVNHHDNLIATGAIIVERLKKLENEIITAANKPS